MKKVSSWVSVLVLVSLAACSYPAGGISQNLPGATATLSPVQVQTQINEMLTTMPTSTGQPEQGTATPALPTLPVATETVAAAGATATAFPEAAATATSAPTASAATATSMPAAAAAPTGTTAPTSAATATATQPTGPTFTPAPGDPRSRLGNPTSTDPMDNATAWVWPTGTDQYSETSFSGGYQTVTALTKTDAWRMANPTGEGFGNIYLEATFRTGSCSGSDHYGLIARVPVVTEPTQGYMFEFTCDGKYTVRRWDGEVSPKGVMTRLVDWKASTAIATGPNQVNHMGVMLVGSRLMLYANGKLLADVKDTLFPSGNFGVLVGSQNTAGFKIQVDTMSYWLNPQP